MNKDNKPNKQELNSIMKFITDKMDFAERRSSLFAITTCTDARNTLVFFLY